MTTRPRLTLPALGSALLLATAPIGPALAQTPTTPDLSLADAGRAVLVVVKVPRPWYAPRFLIDRKMRDTMPQYAHLPGLMHKAYSHARSDGAFGGLYLWRDRATAAAWFGPAWFERVQRERGVTADVRLFAVTAAIDLVPGGTPTDDHSPSVATLSFTPPAASDAGTPVPGLLRRYRVIDDRQRGGELSLWRDEAAARAQLAPAEQREAEWFDTPILLPTAIGPAMPPTAQR